MGSEGGTGQWHQERAIRKGFKEHSASGESLFTKILVVLDQKKIAVKNSIQTVANMDMNYKC